MHFAGDAIILNDTSLPLLCADEDICKLYCIAEDYDFFFAMSSKVKDGTTCSDHKEDVCIDGVCEVYQLCGFTVLQSETTNMLYGIT